MNGPVVQAPHYRRSTIGTTVHSLLPVPLRRCEQTAANLTTPCVLHRAVCLHTLVAMITVSPQTTSHDQAVPCVAFCKYLIKENSKYENIYLDSSCDKLKAVRKHAGLTSNACVTWPHCLKLPFTIHNSWALPCSPPHWSLNTTIFPSTASQTAHTCLSPKPKHHLGTNHTVVLCWAANPSMICSLRATSQTMKSHSFNHTPCPLGF